MSAVSALVYKARMTLKNTGRIMEAQSRFKVVFVVTFALLFEVGLFYMFWHGFRFLDTFEGLGAMVINRLFALFFLGMGLMLIISSVVTAYSSLFRSDEVPFLLTRPYEMGQIVTYKFLEATGLSSWAFLFIVIPFVGAFAWHREMTVLFALWTLLFCVPFQFLCSGLGTLVTLAVVRWMPQGRFWRRAGLAVVAGVVVWLWVMAQESYDPSQEAHFNIARLVPGLRLASNELLPSWWVSDGVMALAQGEWMRGGMLWGVLAAHALLVTMLVEWFGGWSFYTSWQNIMGRKQTDRRPAILFGFLRRWLRFIPRDVIAVVLKDVRTFFRDPVQWSQAIIFFGLLAIYFANLRRFNYHIRVDHWKNMMGFLNVFSVSAVMCSLASRFVYPQLSLEGHGFWIIGLSPTTLKRILMTKFWVSLVAMVGVGVGLIALSAHMLEVAPDVFTVSIVLVAAISMAVCGLSTGLGSVFLDLRQRNPSAIVSGFGGTLNLVISLGFTLAAVLPFMVVYHVAAMMSPPPALVSRWLLGASVWLAVVTAAVTALPLWMGVRSLSRRDF